jgi:hypothetical protein
MHRRDWSPGQFLVVPPSCSALLGCQALPRGGDTEGLAHRLRQPTNYS